MQIVNSSNSLRQTIQAVKNSGRSVAFVPTMGNLHVGHLSLVEIAKKHADYVVVSIFVNPMQFGKNEDIDAYPKTLEEDSKSLDALACDLLFVPSVKDVYPSGLEGETRVNVPSLDQHHCGRSRPGHFVGVATVVTKLFNMVQPEVAIFGLKDFQQLALIRKMVLDLCMPIKIVGVPTSRELSGLARSSRNGYLSDTEKNTAAMLYKILSDCKQQIEIGESNFQHISTEAKTRLKAAGFKNDYFNIANASTLEEASIDDKQLVILAAAWLGKTRLIDNITISI